LCGRLIYFIVIWYILGMLCRQKSGNPVLHMLRSV
jgi:hypothetical protein